MKEWRPNRFGKRGLYEYCHNEINKEFRFISGHCVLTDEIRTAFHGRTLLYLLGYGVLDTACCGVTGCGYALVQGFVMKWKYKKKGDSHLVSLVSPICEQGLRQKVQNEILRREIVQQVLFI